jgi:hypothetical protein
MDNLELKIRDLRKAVTKNKTGHLPLSERIELLELSGDAKTVSQIFFECLKKVYPAWHEHFRFGRVDGKIALCQPCL